MGFLDHSTNNIIVDAVLTDHGRSLIAQTGTNGNIIQGYSFADDEVDYTIIKKYGVAVGKEKIEKNTPIFEASTNTSNGVSSYLYTSDSTSTAIGLNLTWDLPVATSNTAGADVGADSQTVTLNITPVGLTGGDTYTLRVEFDENHLNYAGSEAPAFLYPSSEMLPNMKYVTCAVSDSGSVYTKSFTTKNDPSLSATTIMPTMIFVGGTSGGVSSASIGLKIINRNQSA